MKLQLFVFFSRAVFSMGSFCSHSPEYCSLFFFFFFFVFFFFPFSVFLLDCSFLSLLHFSSSQFWSLWWFVLKVKPALWKRIISAFSNCTRYITPTPWSSFSVFSVHWKHVAFRSFGNHEFVKKKVTCLPFLVNYVHFYVSWGFFIFKRMIFITSYWCSLSWQLFPLFQCKCLDFYLFMMENILFL